MAKHILTARRDRANRESNDTFISRAPEFVTHHPFQLKIIAGLFILTVLSWGFAFSAVAGIGPFTWPHNGPVPAILADGITDNLPTDKAVPDSIGSTVTVTLTSAND